MSPTNEHLTRQEICDYMNWVTATVVDGANLSFMQRLAVMALAYLDTQEAKELKEAPALTGERRKREPELVIGNFYWARPVFCPDRKEDWWNEDQPARFAGYDENNQELWMWIDTEGTHWPNRWLGREIPR